MKYTHNIFLSLISVAVLSTSVAYGHGKKEHADETVEYDETTKAFGEYMPGMEPTHTIEVSMKDTMRFSPESIKVNQGDVIQFVLKNEGQLKHEFVLGTNESLKEHAAMMMKFPGMEHEEAYMAHVNPGEEMEILWKFSKSGDYEFGCLLPGHFDAGMRGTIRVAS